MRQTTEVEIELTCSECGKDISENENVYCERCYLKTSPISEEYYKLIGYLCSRLDSKDPELVLATALKELNETIEIKFEHFKHGSFYPKDKLSQ